MGLAISLTSQVAMQWGLALLSSFLEDHTRIELQQEKTFKTLGCLALDFGLYLLLLEVPGLLSLVLSWKYFTPGDFVEKDTNVSLLAYILSF